MSKKLELNIGHDFGLTLPQNLVIQEIELTIKYRTNDGFSSTETTLKYLSEFKEIKR